MLENFGVTEATWRDACTNVPGFAISESPAYVVRGVAALASDPDHGRFAGQVRTSRQLADEYAVTDTDGTRPDCWALIAAHGWDDQDQEVIDRFRWSARPLLSGADVAASVHVPGPSHG
jgi:hypothetical protein